MFSDEKINLLIPRPQRSRVAPMSVELPAELVLVCEHDHARVATRWLQGALAREGLAPRPGEAPGDGGAVAVVLRARAGTPEADGIPQRVRSQGYRLEVGARQVTITGFGEAGVLYGAATLVQWIRLHREGGPDAMAPGTTVEVSAVEITDWPDLANRGVMLDISRDKVPTMDTLLELVDLLTGLKINQLQLYMEHTFAYRGHETVWRDASALTPLQVQHLDGWCSERCVDLVPNQNSLGHFHRWLQHEPYRHLAECPEGVDHPFSRGREPFSLCPTDPEALALMEQLYDHLLPNFQSTQFNVGLDETMDIGTGRSAAQCQEQGTVEVYLEYLCKVHQLVHRRGRRMQFWGDIILKRPDLIGELPRDVIALEWGYEEAHPFEEHTPHFAASGLDFYVCPGTSSWNSFGGRLDNALGNLGRAATVGRDQNAAGYLITDWGDSGHLQPLPVSYPAYLAGAGFSWNVNTARAPGELPLVRLLELHAPEMDRHTARALVELGRAYLHTGASPTNGTVLFYLLRFPDGPLSHRRLRDLTAQGLTLTAEHVDRVVDQLMDRPGTRLQRELCWIGGLLGVAARLGLARLETGAEGSCAELPEERKVELRHELEPLIQQHESIWLGRNRPGGRKDSVTWLTRVKELLW